MIFTNPSQSRESILILEWGKHSLSFSVFLEHSNRVLSTQLIETHFNLFTATKEEFNQFIKLQPIFSYSFRQLVCLIDTSFITLVPHKHFQEAKIESFLSFNFKLPAGNLDFQSMDVLSSEYKALYALPLNLVEAVKQNFLNVNFRPTNATVLNYFARFIQLDSFFSLHFNHDFFTITYYKENKLMYYNTFSFVNAEDIVYYTLNVMNDLKLNNEQELVYYSGAIEENGSSMLLIKDYIKFLKPLERTNKINYALELAQMPQHYFIHHYANCL